MADNKRFWDPWKMYDVSDEEMRALKERAKMRAALKAEWTKKYTNPWKGAEPGGHLFDPAVQRFIALKATQPEHFKGALRSAVIGVVLYVLPVAGLAYAIKKTKEENERRYRSGEVTCKDRQDKFVY